MVAPQEMPNRLLLNAKWQSNPCMTGVQRYAQGLTEAMQAADMDFDLAVPAHSGSWRETLWEQRSLPNIARRYETLLCPANMAPLQLDKSVRLLLTIHCLRFRFHPANYPASFVRWYNFAIPRLIERAETIFTVSEAQKREIESVYPSANHKVRVMSPGVNAAFHPDHERDPAAPSEPYFVYIGSAAPAKNLKTLLNAYRELDHAHKLVLIGVDQSQIDLICPDQVRGRLIPIGHIADITRISALLAHAVALLAPSHYESFGLPCLEAMASGCPVVASNIPAHREVCQDAAEYADPQNPHEWISHIESVLNNSNRREMMREQGLARVKAYSWSDAVSTLNYVLSHPSKALA